MVRLLWIGAVAVWGVCTAFAGPLWAVTDVPEIDPTAASAEVGLLMCAVLILVERRTKR